MTAQNVTQLLVALALAAAVTGSASALTTALVVKDTITEPLRAAVWRRFPRDGQGSPVPALDGDGWDESPGSFLGNVIACTCCFGVWSTAAWTLAWTLTVAGFPGHGVADGTVLTALQFCAACTVQRRWNAAT